MICMVAQSLGTNYLAQAETDPVYFNFPIKDTFSNRRICFYLIVDNYKQNN